MKQTVDDIKQRLKQADAKEFEVLSRTLADDPRKGVQAALRQAQERLRAQADEEQRIAALYQYESDLASGGVIVGLDEVGRGPLAGPLTIGAVVLPRSPQIQGLNDSKKLTPATRSELAPLIKETALAYAPCRHRRAGHVQVLAPGLFPRCCPDRGSGCEARCGSARWQPPSFR